MNERRAGAEKGALAAILAACGICCAGPILGILAALGVTASLAAVVVPGPIVVAVVTAGGVWWLRRRSRQRCAVAPGPVDLPQPQLRREA